MTAKPDNLILDHLRNLRKDMSKMAGQIELLTAEVRISNAHVSGIVQSDVLTSTRLAELEARLDRVERRLELTDV